MSVPCVRKCGSVTAASTNRGYYVLPSWLATNSTTKYLQAIGAQDVSCRVPPSICSLSHVRAHIHKERRMLDYFASLCFTDSSFSIYLCLLIQFYILFSYIHGRFAFSLNKILFSSRTVATIFLLYHFLFYYYYYYYIIYILLSKFVVLCTIVFYIFEISSFPQWSGRDGSSPFLSISSRAIDAI